MNYETEDFDSLLENSLQTYANAEPRPGLDERILARTQIRQSVPMVLQQRQAKLQFWGWSAAAAMLTMVAVAIIYPYAVPHPPVSESNLPSPIPPALTATNTPAPGRAVRQPRPHHPVTSKTGVAPLESTPQERLFAEFLALHREDASVLATQQARLDQPLKTIPLEIQPIQIQLIPSTPIVIDPIQTNSTQMAR